jgi:hypothetical protein
VDFVHQFPVAIVPKKDTFSPEQEFADLCKGSGLRQRASRRWLAKRNWIWLSNGGLRFAPYRRI